MPELTAHKKLEKTRKPRVHIQYEVETEAGNIAKELPFVVGVLGDFSGHATEAKKSLREKKFIQIDGENFDQVMHRIQPKLHLQVENALSDRSSPLNVHLEFHGMDDFSPENLVQNIPELKRLFDMRNHLRDLLSKVDRSEQLESLLESILQDPEALQHLSAQLRNNHE